jgi:hypothetical protein
MWGVQWGSVLEVFDSMDGMFVGWEEVDLLSLWVEE